MSRKRREPEKIVAKLRRLGCRRLSVWPRHPQQDTLTDLVKAGSLNTLGKTNRTLAALLWVVAASAVRPKPLRSGPRPRH
jgi:hypothetical protein